jgi:hypothetical protein
VQQPSEAERVMWRARQDQGPVIASSRSRPRGAGDSGPVDAYIRVGFGSLGLAVGDNSKLRTCVPLMLPALLVHHQLHWGPHEAILRLFLLAESQYG